MKNDNDTGRMELTIYSYPVWYTTPSPVTVNLLSTTMTCSFQSRTVARKSPSPGDGANGSNTLCWTTPNVHEDDPHWMKASGGMLSRTGKPKEHCAIHSADSTWRARLYNAGIRMSFSENDWAVHRPRTHQLITIFVKTGQLYRHRQKDGDWAATDGQHHYPFSLFKRSYGEEKPTYHHQIFWGRVSSQRQETSFAGIFPTSVLLVKIQHARTNLRYWSENGYDVEV